MRGLCVLGLAFGVCLWGLPAAGAGDPTETLGAGGVARTYVLHVPPGGDPPAARALVLAFHGGGGRGRGMVALTGLDALADRDGFIAVYPDGINRQWNDGRRTVRWAVDDVGFVAALIAALSHRFHIDRGRVYATGISNGGLFAERLACDLAPDIAAIAPVAGNMPADIAPACAPARPVSLIQISGTQDPLVPYGGGQIARPFGLGEGGVVWSVADTVAFWARRDGCDGAPVRTTPAPIAPPDGTRVVRTAYERCARGTSVALYTIEGGGHTWPGGPQYLPVGLIGPASRQLNASEVIVEFFRLHPMH
ncbi:MAG TPA: PHB depolymerase family esterase [bacterium]|nr:PHB depolymerase family esterase [bacterium]